MTRDKEVRARVSAELKFQLRCVAAERAEEDNESLIVREALVWYFSQPEVKMRMEEGRRRLETRSAGTPANPM